MDQTPGSIFNKAQLANNVIEEGRINRPLITETPRVLLQTQDNMFILENVNLLKCSAVFRSMLDSYTGEVPDGTIIPLKGIHSSLLRKILHWAQYHYNDGSPAWDPNWTCVRRPLEIPDWDGEFLREDITTLFKMISAADYLDIKWLFALICQKVANKCEGKTPLQMRQETKIIPKKN